MGLGGFKKSENEKVGKGEKNDHLPRCYSGVLRASKPPATLWHTRVLVTRSEATMEQWMEAAWTTQGSRRACRGQEQEGGGRILADDVYPEYWRSTHLSDDGRETPRASGHCMCFLRMHMYCYDRAEVRLILFRSIRFQSYAVESQIRKANKRICNVGCRIQL